MRGAPDGVRAFVYKFSSGMGRREARYGRGPSFSSLVSDPRAAGLLYLFKIGDIFNKANPRKKCGRPLGMDAASFMANLFLFVHELEFMTQFLTPLGAEDTAEADDNMMEAWTGIFCRHFRYIKRY